MNLGSKKTSAGINKFQTQLRRSRDQFFLTFGELIIENSNRGFVLNVKL